MFAMRLPVAQTVARRLLRAAVVSFLGLLLLAAGAASLAGVARSADEGSRVVVLPVKGIVDQVMAGFIRDGVQRAANDGATAVVLRIDTPGGSLESTREIVQSLLEAPVPVITWVAPQGSRAASAGTFITLAGNLAFMAPGTNIGAASPVGGQGEDIEGTLGKKVLNDAIASITSLAEARGRPVDWAVSTVKDAASYTAIEAVAAGAVDGIAATLDDVLSQASGREVTVAGKPVTLDLAGATTEESGMNPLQGLLHLLADPNIAFILFTVGFYGLFFELQNPNFVTGILGAIALLLAFIGFGSLPLNVGGLLLIGLAIVMFVLELTVTSHGLLTIGGLVCFVLGAAALYTEPTSPTGPDVQVAWPVIGVMVVMTAAFMAVIVTAALRSRRMALVPIGLGGGSGGTLAAGTTGEVRRPLDLIGSVFASGEEWTAKSVRGDRLGRGQLVRVVGQDGLTLLVEPSPEAASPAEPSADPPAGPAERSIGGAESNRQGPGSGAGPGEFPGPPKPGDRQEVSAP
jgi:membrane-bound serine protease (ClpP class)